MDWQPVLCLLIAGICQQPLMDRASAHTEDGWVLEGTGKQFVVNKSEFCVHEQQHLDNLV